MKNFARRYPAKDLASGLAPNFAPSVPSFSVCLIAFFFVACACRGGAKRRHLYQDKHTPRLQFVNFPRFLETF